MEVRPWMNNLTVEGLDKRLKEYDIVIDRTIFELAETLAPKNPYHNFGHELQVANTVIDLWEIQNKNKTKKDLQGLKLLVIAALFHDAWYTMEEKYTQDLEKRACQLINNIWWRKIFKKLRISPKDVNNLILSTKLTSHGTVKDELSKILQDADFGCFWYGPEYLLYSGMNLIDEGEISLKHFIEDERYFLEDILQKKLFVSKTWKELFQNPFETIGILYYRWQDVINEAYDLRKEKLTYSKFVEKLHAFIKAKWRKVRPLPKVP